MSTLSDLTAKEKAEAEKAKKKPSKKRDTNGKFVKKDEG
jgi:hypothetical protein